MKSTAAEAGWKVGDPDAVSPDYCTWLQGIVLEFDLKLYIAGMKTSEDHCMLGFISTESINSNYALILEAQHT